MSEETKAQSEIWKLANSRAVQIDEWKKVAAELEHALRVCFPYDEERGAMRAQALRSFEELHAK